MADDDDRNRRIAELVTCRTKLDDAQAALLRKVFPALVEAQKPKALARLRRRGLSPQDVEDVFQETYLALYFSVLEEGFPLDLGQKLHSTLEGKLANHLAYKKRHPESAPLPSSGSEKPKSSQPDADRAVDERTVALELVHQLPSVQRDAFEIVVLGGVSQELAAEILGIPEGTLKSRLRAAKEALAVLVAKSPPSGKKDPQ